MPWTKNFDVDEVLDSAKRSFWENGYGATSMETLLRDMDIRRGSFYDTFGDKRAVLIEALRRYAAEDQAAVLAAAREESSPRRAIGRVFEHAVDGARCEQGRLGCFVVNTAIELAPRDAEVAQVVREVLASVERSFAELVAEGQQAGEIRADLDAVEVGRSLMNQLVGLMVLVRAGVPKPVVDSAVQQARRLVD